MKERFNKLRNGYVIDRKIMLVGLAISYLIISVTLTWSFIYGFDSVECPIDSVGDCINPFYGACDNKEICFYENIPPGVIINKQPWYIAYNLFVLIITAVVIFGMNHFKYNRDFDFSGDNV